MFVPMLLSAQNAGVAPSEETPAEAAPFAGLQAALAVLPRETEAYAAWGKQAGTDKVLFNAFAEGDDAKVEIEGMAVGFGAGSAASWTQLLPFFHVLDFQHTEASWAEIWAALAHENRAPLISRQWEQHRQEDWDRAIEALSRCRIAPIYGVLTVNPAMADKLPALQQSLVASFCRAEGAEPAEYNEWKGARLHLPATLLPEDNLTMLQAVRLREAAARLSLSLLCTVRGNALIVVLCSDAAEAQPAVSEVSSVLAGEASAVLRRHENPLLLASVSPALQNLQREAALQTLHSMAGFATGVFKTLTVEDAPSKQIYSSAVGAVGTWVAEWEKLTPEVDAPLTLVAWADGDWHIECRADACGARFTAEPGACLPDGENAFFTLVCDPVRGRAVPDAAAMLRSCEAVVEGVAETLNNRDRESWNMLLMQYRLFSTEQAAFSEGLQACGRAFSGKWALWADGKGVVPGSLLGGSPVQMVPVPRVALLAGVRQRSELDAAWNSLCDGARRTLDKVGGDAAAIGNLPIAVSSAGEATLYSLSLPMCCPDFSPSVAVHDKAWVASSSAALGAELAKLPQEAAKTPAGASFCFRPKKLSVLLRSMQQADETAEDLAEAAKEVEDFAEAVREISGRFTISDDDVLHLHVDIKSAR